MVTFFTHDTVKKWRYAISFLRKRLVHVNLQLLYTCNFRCRICDFWKPAYQGHPRLSLAQVEVIGRQLNQVGPQVISIGGGEPMLHPDLVAITQTLSRQHFPVMITNGWLVTPERARALFQAGMVEISVSVDYFDAHKHEAQRGQKESYQRALEALRILHENRTHPEQRVNMISVIMDDNLADVEPLIRLCADMGITYLLTLYSHSRGAKPAKVIPQEVSVRLLELKSKYRHFVALHGYIGRFSEALSQGGIGPCYAGRHLCNIDSQGQVTFCIDRLDEPAGNILSDDMKTIVKKLRTGHRGNRCHSCWTSCRGSIETLMYGRHRLQSLYDYYQMTRPVPLGRGF